MSVYETLLDWARRRENPIWSQEEVAVGREQWSSQLKRVAHGSQLYLMPSGILLSPKAGVPNVTVSSYGKEAPSQACSYTNLNKKQKRHT